MPAAATALHSSLRLSSPKLPPEPPNNLLIPKPKTPVHQEEVRQTVSLEFKQKIIRLETIGVDSGRALSRNPSLRTAPLRSIDAVVAFLQSSGLHLKDLARILGMCPEILTSDIKSDLEPVFYFISGVLGVPDRKFRKVINKCPRFVISSVEHQLRPALFYLHKLGLRDPHALAYRDPILLVSNVEKTLIPKLDYLVSLGLSKGDAAAMVRRCPGLFTFSIENNFKPKFKYLAEEIEGKLEELKEFPQYFAFSLEKRIDPRHKEVVRCGVKVGLPLMLKSSDEEFRELLNRGSV